MGFWGITERESNCGLNLLGTIVATKVKAADFATFNVADAFEVIKADIMEEIRKANHSCSAKDLVFYVSMNFTKNFTHGLLLVAECLDDYYRNGKLIVTEYIEEKYDPVDHHIREFVVTPADLKILLDELQSVQNPKHELYQFWFGEDTRQKWLAHIQSVQQILKEREEAQHG